MATQDLGGKAMPMGPADGEVIPPTDPGWPIAPADLPADHDRTCSTHRYEAGGFR